MTSLQTEAVGASGQMGRSIDKLMWKRAAERIGDGYYEIDLNGNFVYLNDALACMLGIPRDELLASSHCHFSRFADKETAALLAYQLDRALKTGGADHLIEGRFVRMDGASALLEMSIAILYDGLEHPIGYCGIVRDITARTRSQQLLDQRLKMLATLQQVDIEINHTLEIERVLDTAISAAIILSNADAGGIALLEDGVFRAVRGFGGYVRSVVLQPNGIVGRVSERKQAELVLDVSADPDYQVVVPDMRAQITCPMLIHNRITGVLVLETHEPARFSNDVFEFIQLLTARVASAIDNAQLYGVAQTQLAELRALNAQLQELEQLKSDMIRIASHDLRSPLGIIGGYLSILRDDLHAALTPEHHMYIEAMMQGIERIDRLTTDFLSLERLHTIKQPPSDVVDFSLLVKKAVYDAQEPARRKRLALHSDIFSEPLEVIGEESDLYEALVNLISNAIKYTPRGGQIFVRLSIDGDRALFVVEDTGIGIPEEYHARLFQSFFRVKTLETRDIPGTGLGLHLVKKIVERHHGEIVFNSIVGHGSIFGFTVPLASSLNNAEGSDMHTASV